MTKVWSSCFGSPKVTKLKILDGSGGSPKVTKLKILDGSGGSPKVTKLKILVEDVALFPSWDVFSHRSFSFPRVVGLDGHLRLQADAGMVGWLGEIER